MPTQDQINLINSYSPEQKAQLRAEIEQELSRRGGQAQSQSMGGRILSGVGKGLMAGVRALPYVLKNQVPPEPKPSVTDEINEFLAKEKLKQSIDPSSQLAQMRLDAIKNRANGGVVPGGVQDSVEPVVEPVPSKPGVSGAGINQTYRKVPTGEYDEFTGQPKFKYELTPESEASAAGLKTKATKQAEAEAAMKPAIKIVKMLRADWEKSFPDAPKVGKGTKRFEYGAKKSYEALTQENPQVASYLNSRKAYLSLLVRGLGEKGVLTNIDIERVAGAIGSQWDTKDTVKKQFDNLEKLLGADIQGYVDKGGDPSVIQEVVDGVQNKMDPLGWRY